MRLTDGEREILAELNADARYTEHQIAELVDECDTFAEVVREICDADMYPPHEWNDTGAEVVPFDDSEIPY